MKQTKRPYSKPEVQTMGSQQVIEAMGVAHAGTYTAILNVGYGD